MCFDISVAKTCQIRIVCISSKVAFKENVIPCRWSFFSRSAAVSYWDWPKYHDPWPATIWRPQPNDGFPIPIHHCTSEPALNLKATEEDCNDSSQHNIKLYYLYWWGIGWLNPDDPHHEWKRQRQPPWFLVAWTHSATYNIFQKYSSRKNTDISTSKAGELSKTWMDWVTSAAWRLLW